MTRHHDAGLPAVAAMLLLAATLVAIDSTAGTPRESVPYPDQPAAVAPGMAPTFWGFP